MNVLQSFLHYIWTKHFGGSSNWHSSPRSAWSKSLQRDLAVGRDVLMRTSNTTWWDWTLGLTLLFWRWPSQFQRWARDGVPLFINRKCLPRYMKQLRWPIEELQREKLLSKLNKVRRRGYIQPGFVKSLTGYFAVPKAETDIRVVYDAKKCGLNETLWAPNFILPTVDTILRNVSDQSWFGDLDLGEMFLNYPLDPSVQPCAGVDVTEVARAAGDLGDKTRLLKRWNRMLMGFKPSPYIATLSFAWLEEVIVGHYTNPGNPFFWDQVILDLPTGKVYNPSLPWIYKWDSLKGRLPGYFGISGVK